MTENIGFTGTATVANHEDFVLTFDWDDVEAFEMETPRDVIELPGEPGTAVRRQLGRAHFHLDVHFKEGKGIRWESLK